MPFVDPDTGCRRRALTESRVLPFVTRRNARRSMGTASGSPTSSTSGDQQQRQLVEKPAGKADEKLPGPKDGDQ
jgi:hypothetical protein